MFNWFKKSKSAVQVLAAPALGRVYSKEVEEIHHAFETASDRALKAAVDIISKNAHLKEKAEKLKACGFTAVPEVAKVKDVEMTEELAKRIQYYQTYYPNNKFISHEQIKQICEKYDLIYGPVDRFIGFVPAVKLEQIAAFKLRTADTPDLVVHDREGEVIGYASCEEMCGKYKNGHLRDIEAGRAIYVSYDNDVDKNLAGGDAKWGKFSKFSKYTPSLMICAPQKDFNTQGMQVTDRKLRNIPDPVVIHPVPGGGLILAAWGDEASDPLVVNGVNN